MPSDIHRSRSWGQVGPNTVPWMIVIGTKGCVIEQNGSVVATRFTQRTALSVPLGDRVTSRIPTIMPIPTAVS